jgi:hypothetical protein
MRLTWIGTRAEGDGHRVRWRPRKRNERGHIAGVLLTVGYREDGRPDRIICSYNTFNKMAVKAWNKIVPMNKAEATSTGVASLGLVTPHGTIPFMVDSSCPDSVCYMLTMDTWRLVHLSGALPERITDAASAGQMFQTADDSVQIRYRAGWNLVCLSPIDNGVFTVDSTNF